MNHRKPLLISVMILSILTFSCGSAFRDEVQQRGKAVDRWETSNKSFKIRVTAYSEKEPIWLPKYYYVVESTGANSEEWREILSVRLDDNVPIPREHFKYLNDEIAYFYISNKYAVTVNGNSSWSIWDAAENIQDGDRRNSVFIKEVNISSDGSGNMKLAPRSDEMAVTELSTSDFGQHWNE